MSTGHKTAYKKDWKTIARAEGLSIPAAALDRVGESLDALEAAFRPLARALPPDTDPAVAFHAALRAESPAAPEDGE